jgi:hypothetical protein
MKFETELVADKNTEISAINDLLDLLNDQQLRAMIGYFWIRSYPITRASIKSWINAHTEHSIDAIEFSELQDFVLNEFEEE